MNECEKMLQVWMVKTMQFFDTVFYLRKKCNMKKFHKIVSSKS